MKNQLEKALADLRHAYHQLTEGVVKDQSKFAEGLIAPVIYRIEKLEAENEALRGALEMAVRQNEHDMLMTGEELRQARAALTRAGEKT